jgi:hypothetical protein
MLHYGIKASSSNTRFVWARTNVNLKNSLLYISVCANLVCEVDQINGLNQFSEIGKRKSIDGQDHVGLEMDDPD